MASKVSYVIKGSSSTHVTKIPATMADVSVSKQWQELALCFIVCVMTDLRVSFVNLKWTHAETTPANMGCV